MIIILIIIIVIVILLVVVPYIPPPSICLESFMPYGSFMYSMLIYSSRQQSALVPNNAVRAAAACSGGHICEYSRLLITSSS